MVKEFITVVSVFHTRQVQVHLHREQRRLGLQVMEVVEKVVKRVQVVTVRGKPRQQVVVVRLKMIQIRMIQPRILINLDQIVKDFQMTLESARKRKGKVAELEVQVEDLNQENENLGSELNSEIQTAVRLTV